MTRDPSAKKLRSPRRRCLISLLSAAAILGTAQNVESAMDRSLATVGASVLTYANYLYLSELFGKPTAMILKENRYCVDTLSEERIRTLRKNIQEIIQQDFWRLDCTPVKPIIRQNKDKTFELELKYINLMPHNQWTEKFKAAVVSEQVVAMELIPEDRQLQLDKYYGLTPLKYFRIFGSLHYVRGTLMDITKIAKTSIETKNDGTIGEIKFSAQGMGLPRTSPERSILISTPMPLSAPSWVCSRGLSLAKIASRIGPLSCSSAVP